MSKKQSNEVTEFISMKEAAQKMGWNYHRFVAAINRGKIPVEDTIKVGWAKLIRKTAVDKFKQEVDSSTGE